MFNSHPARSLARLLVRLACIFRALLEECIHRLVAPLRGAARCFLVRGLHPRLPLSCRHAAKCSASALQYVCGLAFWFKLFAAAPAALGAPITATPLTQDLHLRKNAPIPLELRVGHSGQGVEAGRFEATLLYRSQRAATVTSQELVFSSGERVVPFVLPPPPGIQDGDALAIRLRWLNGKSAVDLGETRLGIYGFASNELILAVVRTQRRLPEIQMIRERSLALENLRPRLDTAGWRTFNTILAPIQVENLPLHPLGWCAYDSVYLDTSAFASASEKQLNALARWLEAGGSAFIAVGDDSITPLLERHAAFLTRLAGPGGPVFRAAAGRVTTGATTPAQPLRLRPVLGRVSVEFTPGKVEKDYGTNEWNAAVGWSWKLRETELKVVEEKGKWSPQAQTGRPDMEQMEDWQIASWLWSTAIGYDAISPDKPRPLPIAMVAFLLGTLLLAVGPGDWLLLGWLRRRRWTWVLLPILCLLAAWWANSLAARTIGRGDRTGLVTITDIGPDGRILRQCRMEMILPARDREWAVQTRDGLGSPFARVSQNRFDGAETPDVSDNSGEWKSPGLYEHRRNLRQWTPVMAQSTAFPDGKDETGLEWDKLAEQWSKLSAADRTRTLLGPPGWNVVFATPGDMPNRPPADVVDGGAVADFPDFHMPVRVEGRIADLSRMRMEAACALLEGNGPAATEQLISHRSPTLTGVGALLSAPPSPLTALAWTESTHEMHIVRRHFLRKP